ncbi:SORBS1 family protein [Megaselia abdita]
MPNNRKKKSNNKDQQSHHHHHQKKNKNRNKNSNNKCQNHPQQQNVTVALTPPSSESSQPSSSADHDERKSDVDQQCITSGPTILEVSESSSSIEAIESQPVVVEVDDCVEEVSPVGQEDIVVPPVGHNVGLKDENQVDVEIEEDIQIGEIDDTEEIITPDTQHYIKEIPVVVEATSSEDSKTQEIKAKRIQNRIELESHFFPHLQNPRFLDPISEENSDSSDVERKPEKLQTPQSPKMKHANVAFPKPNAELSKRRKHLRQEETIPLIVETKILHEMPVEEQCGFWDIDTTPTLENAEVMYISGSSSAASCSDSESIDSEDIRIETPIIDVNASIYRGDIKISDVINRDISIAENLDDILLESYSSSPSSSSVLTNPPTNTEIIKTCNEQTTLSCSSDEKNLLIREDVAPNTAENSSNGSMENENTSNVRKILKLSEISRERSFESTYSEDSQTSQCTAIHTGIQSPPICDFADFTKIKQLKVLCIEKLMAMPYGNVVMENLALSSENLEYLLLQQEQHSRHLENLIEQGKSQFEQYMREKSNSPPPVPPSPVYYAREELSGKTKQHHISSQSIQPAKTSPTEKPRLLNIMLEEKADPRPPPTPQERVEKLDTFCSQIKPVIPAFFKNFESSILKNTENVSRPHAIEESERHKSENMMSFEKLTTTTTRSSDKEPKAFAAEDKRNMNENTTKEFLNNEIFKDFDNLSKMLKSETSFPVKEEISIVREFPKNPREEIAKARAEFLNLNKPENRNSFHSSRLIERPSDNKRHTVHESSSSSQSYSSKEHFIPIRKAEGVSNLTSFPVGAKKVDGFSSSSDNVHKEHIVKIQKESVPEVPKRKEENGQSQLAFSSFFKNSQELPSRDQVDKRVHFETKDKNNNIKEHIVEVAPEVPKRDYQQEPIPTISKFSSFFKNTEDKSTKLMKEVILEDDVPSKPSFFGQRKETELIPEPPKREDSISPPEIPLPPIPAAPRREHLIQTSFGDNVPEIPSTREYLIQTSIEESVPEIPLPPVPVAPRREHFVPIEGPIVPKREHYGEAPTAVSPRREQESASKREHYGETPTPLVPVAPRREQEAAPPVPVAPKREHMIPIETFSEATPLELRFRPVAPKREHKINNEHNIPIGIVTSPTETPSPVISHRPPEVPLPPFPGTFKEPQGKEHMIPILREFSPYENVPYPRESRSPRPVTEKTAFHSQLEALVGKQAKEQQENGNGKGEERNGKEHYVTVTREETTTKESTTTKETTIPMSTFIPEEYRLPKESKNITETVKELKIPVVKNFPSEREELLKAFNEKLNELKELSKTVFQRSCSVEPTSEAPEKVNRYMRHQSVDRHDHISQINKDFEDFLQNQKPARKFLSCQNLGESLEQERVNLNGSSENIARPIMKEVQICENRQAGKIRAPRLSTSSMDVSSTYHPHYHQSGRLPTYMSQSTTNLNSSSNSSNVRRNSDTPNFSLYNQQTGRLPTYMSRPHSTSFQGLKQKYHAPIAEDPLMNQHMTEEWLDKIAEREERRLQKIIKISQLKNETKSNRKTAFEENTNIGEEFLKKAKERRRRFCMQSDSDRESGTDAKGSETDEPSVKITDDKFKKTRHLPQHLRDFVQITKEFKKEENTSADTSSSVQGRYPYKSSGYQSEPEGYHYDSDYYTMNNKPLDRRRTVWPPAKETESNQRPYIPNIIKSGSPPYRVHPGKIEDYTPGFSSLVVDKKEEVKKGTLSHLYTEGNLARSLLEQGYESDSNLIFHKKQIEENDLDKYLNDYEKRQSYKRMQIGGEPPLLGFRKPAPEKPKVSPSRYIETDVNIHYKSPVRFECKELIAEDELAHLQAERMKKVYEQEKYDKYIRQLQDINSRRHRDHFMSSQKSPIPLNRYDDFNSEYICIKSPNLIPPNTISKALYDFKGQSLRELSFKKGDYIILRRQIDNNWFEGEHNARVGLLPIKYVEVMTKELGRRPKTPSEGQARAKYSFNAQSAVELSLNKGELVTLTRRVDGNWFEGKIANRKGIFPVNYVEVLTDIGAEDKLTKSIAEYSATVSATARNNYNNNIIPIDSIKETKTVSHSKVLHVDTEHEPVLYRALYKYRPQNNDELELKEGDLVFVLEVCDDGWYVGTSQRTGCFGTFPGNYVQMVRD